MTFRLEGRTSGNRILTLTVAGFCPVKPQLVLSRNSASVVETWFSPMSPLGPRPPRRACRGAVTAAALLRDLVWAVFLRAGGAWEINPGNTASPGLACTPKIVVLGRWSWTRRLKGVSGMAVELGHGGRWRGKRLWTPGAGHTRACSGGIHLWALVAFLLAV